MTTDYTDMMMQFEIPSNPFPGLRPFEFNESLLYFGRDGQSEQLLRKLAAARFMAVIGTSGSGKSSLVRAGLLPALFGGFMASAGSDWRIALFRPSNDPIGNLAAAINDSGLFGERTEEDARLQATMIEATLRRGSLGLVEAVRQSKIASHENVLVVVDQFEELFRFAQVAESEQYQNDAAAFVKLLLSAAHQKEIPIYVVITMRSDFLGDCSLFWDLPEAINEGQYLIPRLTREQRREAITGPIAVCGADITPRLVNRLLNDMGDNPDQLPILQHALMRTWSNWKESHREDEPIDLSHYEAIGGMSAALSLHADEAYNELPDERSRKIAEKIFKGLTEKGADNREIRRPIELKELCAFTEASEAEVIQVIEVFRREDKSFLMPPAGTRLDSDSLIDISHESLIRNWERLKGWVEDEARSARIYRRLAETAVLHEKGEAGLYRDPDLQLALDWREQSKPNKTWARRYHAEFETAMGFLDASREARDREARDREAQRRKEIKRTRRTAMIFALAFLLSLAALIFATTKKVEADKAKAKLEVAVAEAYKQRNNADEQRSKARKKARQARAEYKAARLAEEIAKGKEEAAIKSAKVAESAQLAAKIAEAAALKDKIAAEHAEDKAQQEAENSRQLLYAANINLAQNAYYEPNIQHAQEMLKEASLQPDDLRGFEWNYLNWLYHREAGALDTGDGPVKDLAYSPDGKYLATVGENSVKLWDASTQRELLSVPTNNAQVNALAFSPDGKLLAYSGKDASVKLQKIGSTEEPLVLRGDAQSFSSLVFSPDGKALFTGGGMGDDTGKIKKWDIASGRQQFEIEIEKGVKMLAVSPDNKMLAVASGNGSFYLFNASTHALLYDRTHSQITSATFSPDGKMILGREGGEIFDLLKITDKGDRADLSQVSSLERFHPVVGFPDRLARSSVVFSPDKKMFAIGSYDTLKIYDATNLDDPTWPALITSLPGQQGTITSMDFSPDGKTLAVNGSGQVRFYDTTVPRDSILLKNQGAMVYKIFPSPGSKTISMLVYDSGFKLKQWDALSLRELSLPPELAEEQEYIAYSPGNKYLATFKVRSSAIKLWDAETHELIATFNSTHPAKFKNIVEMVQVSPDGRNLTAITRVETVRDPNINRVTLQYDLQLWNVDSPGEPVVLKTADFSSYVPSEFSPDGKLFASFKGDLGNKTVELWDVDSRKSVSFDSKISRIRQVAFSPDGKKILVKGVNELDGEIAELRDVLSLSLIKSLSKSKNNLEYMFSPDSRMLALAGETHLGPAVTLWDTETARPEPLTTLRGYAAPVSCMAFSPDGKTLVTGSKDGLATLWSTSSYRLLVTIYNDKDPFTSMTFSPDGQMLITGGKNGTVKLWPTAPANAEWK